MTINRASDRSFLLIGVLLLCTALLTPLIRADTVLAHHIWSPHLHIGTLHTFNDFEHFCTWVHDGSIAHSTARDRIKNTLYVDNPSEDWDGTASNLVYFILRDQPCNNYPQAERNEIEIEYWIHTNGFSECGGTACASVDGAYWNGSEGHTDYRWGYVKMRTNHLTQGAAIYHHVVNHETGHVLGLKDPDYYGHCMGDVSVMHSRYYGCLYDREWPTSNDRNAVASYA